MDFHQAFYDIDTDRSGEITTDELVDYMRKKNYKETFVQKWLSIFDVDNSGTITYEEYCTTLGLVPKDPEPEEEVVTPQVTSKTRSEPQVQEEPMTVQRTTTVRSAPPKRPAGDSGKGAGRSGPRNSAIRSKGGVIMRFSPARVIQKKALYRYKPATVRGGGSKKSEPPKPPTTVTKPVNGEKNGDSRTVPVCKSPRSYPSQNSPSKRKRRSFLHKDHLPRLRDSIRPGSVLILVTGRHKGKRVVFLKQMEQSGLLLVTGPFKLNGCPLRRVNQRHVIATSVQLDVSQVDVPERLTDVYFRRAKARKSKEDGDIFKKEAMSYAVTAERKEDQRKVDSAILSSIAARDDQATMKGYLRSSFSLKSGEYPHLMKF